MLDRLGLSGRGDLDGGTNRINLDSATGVRNRRRDGVRSAGQRLQRRRNRDGAADGRRNRGGVHGGGGRWGIPRLRGGLGKTSPPVQCVAVKESDDLEGSGGLRRRRRRMGTTSAPAAASRGRWGRPRLRRWLGKTSPRFSARRRRWSARRRRRRRRRNGTTTRGGVRRRSESRVKRVTRRILCAETVRGEGEIVVGEGGWYGLHLRCEWTVGI
ncbi:hypothetical protein DAI22_02g035800 [Oryza sativa Japonica Group]|nr:hypothetical protein DAI22_02g035800 [Oryza sativa Japonica Group]